ncbi:hypothetical protein ACJIZ3_016394 [Penstemon smallii]|uniref:Ubiquitin-like domain-containing protein n=1 Tax=Penstemon smallii TaxID=265156 RepID=A0ABD3RU38_9LAMI
MEAFEPEIHQVFLKLIDGKHKILNFQTPSVSIFTLKHRIETLTSIPSHLQLLLSNNSRILHDHQTLTLTHNPQFPETLDTNSNRLLTKNEARKFPAVVHLLLRLRGGKGGFGSLLRGAATKAGQKKTNNFDACRDMSGRRLRHVNAEKKLEEWRAEAEERKLEKMAEDFIKKKAKEVVKSGKRNGGDSSEKYVAKYREDSAKCMEEVERSVRESIKELASSKRKGGVEGSKSDSKRVKIWLGKRKMGESDSEDMDEDDSDEDKEGENEKSVIIDNENHSDSSKEEERSSGSVTGGKLGTESPDQGPSGSGSEDENTAVEESMKSSKSLEENTDHVVADTKGPLDSHSNEVEEIVSQLPDALGSELEVASASQLSSGIKYVPVQEESAPASVEVQDLDKPLNFDEYNSASELEVLGLERLKLELQARGLKCGGTLQERAARLFLLKTTPLEKLPKKLLAKK